MRRLAFALVSLVPLVMLAACNTIFGIDERELATPESGSPDGEGGSVDPDGEAGFVIGTPSCAGGGGGVGDAGECEAIDKLLTTVVADGVANEYCAFPSTTYALKLGGFTGDAGTGFNEVVRFFTSANVNTIAVHVHVEDPKIIVTDTLDQGDSVAVYLDSEDDTLGKSPLKVIVSPPTQTRPMQVFKIDKGTQAPWLADHAGARQVTDGYEVEVSVPWEELGVSNGGPPATKAKVKIDIVVHAREDESDGGKVLTSYWAGNGGATSVGTCTGTRAECDPSSWCNPRVKP